MLRVIITPDTYELKWEYYGEMNEIDSFLFETFFQKDFDTFQEAVEAQTLGQIYGMIAHLHANFDWERMIDECELDPTEPRDVARYLAFHANAHEEFDNSLCCLVHSLADNKTFMSYLYKLECFKRESCPDLQRARHRLLASTMLYEEHPAHAIAWYLSEVSVAYNKAPPQTYRHYYPIKGPHAREQGAALLQGLCDRFDIAPFTDEFLAEKVFGKLDDPELTGYVSLLIMVYHESRLYDEYYENLERIKREKATDLKQRKEREARKALKKQLESERVVKQGRVVAFKAAVPTVSEVQSAKQKKAEALRLYQEEQRKLREQQH